MNEQANLTIPELLQIRKMKLIEAEEYLMAKGWEFHEAEEPTDGKMGVASFTYRKNESDPSVGDAIFGFHYNNYSNTRPVAVSVSVSIKSKYEEYMAAIKDYGFLLLDSKVKDGKRVEAYRDDTTTFVVKSFTVRNASNRQIPTWLFQVYSNHDYDSTFK